MYLKGQPVDISSSRYQDRHGRLWTMVRDARGGQWYPAWVDELEDVAQDAQHLEGEQHGEG